jgi:hypothetical protein
VDQIRVPLPGCLSDPSVEFPKNADAWPGVVAQVIECLHLHNKHEALSSNSSTIKIMQTTVPHPTSARPGSPRGMLGHLCCL